jgi:adenylate cyclase
VLWRGSAPQRLRLASGLVMFTFVLGHFVNHALGLVSVEAMMAFDAWRVAVDDSLPGTAVLVGAVTVHVSLAVWKVARMRSWRVPPWHLAQILLGFCVPLLILPHLVGARLGWDLFGIDTSYPSELVRIWPDAMPRQTALLLVVWAHACIGLHFWLRLAPWYERARNLLLAGAVLLPFAALAGVMMQARAIEGGLVAPAAAQAYRAVAADLPAAEADRLTAWADEARLVFYAATACGLALLGALLWMRRRAGGATVVYVNGPVVRGVGGATLLDISRAFGVPHVSVCGGRGRCSTCRVRVIAAAPGQPPPSEAELRTLRAVGAAADVRLACQWRPSGAITVLRLVKPIEASGRALPGAHDDEGADGEAAVLFVDIRGFTALSEAKLAYDVVHILNRLFDAADRAIEAAGGRVDKYIGDGLMALFEDGRGIAFACRAAFAAAAAIDAALGDINRELAAELSAPLRLAMGLHAGRLVIGRIGAGPAAQMTAIGMVVNVASRLEAAAKTRDAALAVTRVTAERAGIEIGPFGTEKIEMRGVDGPVEVVFVAAGEEMAAAARPLRPALA